MLRQLTNAVPLIFSTLKPAGEFSRFDMMVLVDVGYHVPLSVAIC